MLRIKRLRGGISGFDADSDEEVEIDKSATITSGGIDINYSEHISKRQKKLHTPAPLGSIVDSQSQVQDQLEPQPLEKGKLREQVSFHIMILTNDG